LYLDVNTWIGRWPFRPVPITTVTGLLKAMDRHGIAKSVVSSLHAVFYRNSQAGNEELNRETRGHRDRLIPYATINPVYEGWREDLRICREEFGMAGLRLVPQYHNYRLAGPEARDAVSLASELGMPVAIPMRLEDRRQRHWLDVAPDVSAGEIESIVRACPDATFFVLEGIGLENSALVRDPQLRARVWIEISRFTSVLQESIPRLIETAADRLVFGTGMVLKTPSPALLKVEVLKASKKVKEDIAFRNAARVLKVRT
jgi:predicted TIM-barrel fold metal-dependent hydrolase